MMADRNTTIDGNQIKDRTVKKAEFDATGESTGKVATVQSDGSVDWEFIQTLADYVKLQDNIMLNAFRIAINGSLTQFNMIDGIVDEYEDESGIDNPNSINESYNSTDDYYSPTKDSLDTSPYAHYKCNDDAGNTIVTDDGTGANNGVGNVNTSNYSVAGKINDAFEFNGSSEYINLDALATDIASDQIASISVWIKVTNHAVNGIITFGDTNVESYFDLHVSGGGVLLVDLINSGTIQWRHNGGALSTGTWYHIVVVQDGTSPKIYVNSSDITNLDITTDTTQWLSDISTIDNGRIGCINYNSLGNVFFFDGQTDDVRYYQNKALNQSEINTLYNSGAGTEADQPTGGQALNMTLISNSFTAEAEPDNARMVILEEDVDSITLNTDLKVYASRDGGSSWVQGTLSDEGDYDASKRILVADFDFDQSGIGSGTSMEYKFITDNNKDLQLHASSLNWD